jgi:hypothetical protein
MLIWSADRARRCPSFLVLSRPQCGQLRRGADTLMSVAEPPFPEAIPPLPPLRFDDGRQQSRVALAPSHCDAVGALDGSITGVVSPALAAIHRRAQGRRGAMRDLASDPRIAGASQPTITPSLPPFHRPRPAPDLPVGCRHAAPVAAPQPGSAGPRAGGRDAAERSRRSQGNCPRRLALARATSYRSP